jgi:hypothetical protein
MKEDMCNKLGDAFENIPRETYECLTLDAVVKRQFDFIFYADPSVRRLFSSNENTTIAIRRAIGVSEDEEFKGKIAQHTVYVLDAFLASTENDVRHINDQKFVRVRKWWDERLSSTMAVPDFRALARHLFRQLIASPQKRPNDLKLSFGQ